MQWCTETSIWMKYPFGNVLGADTRWKRVRNVSKAFLGFGKRFWWSILTVSVMSTKYPSRILGLLGFNGPFFLKNVSGTQATHALGFHWYTYTAQGFIHQTQQELIRHNLSNTTRNTCGFSRNTRIIKCWYGSTSVVEIRD